MPAIIGSFVHAATQPATPPVRIFVKTLPHGLTEPIAGTVTFRPAMGPPAPVVVDCCSGPMEVSLPPRTAWEVVPALHGAWAGRQIVAVPDGTSALTITLPVWPVATLSGQFEKPEGSPLPPQFGIAIRDPPGRISGVAFGDEIECPIGVDGHWSCEMPAAAPVDLLLSVRGFIPLQRWEFSIAAGQRRDLGILKLREGASVSGWVRLAQGKLTDALGRAAVVPLVATGGSAAIAGRIARPIAEAAVGKNGYFQIVGVPAGQYAVRVSYPGFATETVLPVQVFARRETTIRKAITLQRPITLKIAVVPPRDWRGMPWNLVLQHASAISGGYDTRPIYAGPAGDGSVVMEDQPRGRYMITVSDSAGNPLANQEFDAASTTADHVVHVDVITVEGSVAMGETPIAATLWFGGRHGSEHVAMRSNADGQFRGILPHNGKWRVSIETDDQDVFQSATDVHSSGGAAHVSLVLPSNEVTGIVVDEHGDPVDGAAVTLASRQNSVVRSSGKDGSFRFRGVEPGDISLTAFLEKSDAQWASDAALRHVGDSGSVGPVQLVLQPDQRLTGTVRSPHGTVAGAAITAFPAGTNQTRGGTAETDLDGHFTVRIAGMAPRAMVTVRAPGCALRVFDVPLPNHAVVLNVPEVGGTLNIVGPSGQSTADALAMFVFQDDRPVSINDLALWAQSHATAFSDRDGIHVDDMAPGDYKVCILPSRVIPMREMASRLSPANCAEGFLSAFGKLTLQLPGAP